MAKADPAAKKPLTKTELYANIAAATGVPTQQVFEPGVEGLHEVCMGVADDSLGRLDGKSPEAG